MRSWNNYIGEHALAGFETVAGKGSFVAEQNTEAIKEEKLKAIEKQMLDIRREAELCGIDLKTLTEMFELICGEE